MNPSGKGVGMSQQRYMQAIVVASFGMLLGCQSSQPTTVTIPGAQLQAVSDGERFGFADSMASVTASTQTGGADGDPIQEVIALLQWEIPPGWQQMPPTPQQHILLAGPEGIQGWVTFFPGDAGGLEGNLARWAASLGLPTAPPTTPLRILGAEGQLFDGVGPHSLRDGTTFDPARMLAAYVLLPSQQPTTLTAKMVGPQTAVTAEREHFLQFLASIKPKAQETP